MVIWWLWFFFNSSSYGYLNDMWISFTCGDGSTSPYKECDPLNGICCDSSCNFKPSGQLCNPAGPCHFDQYCTGTSDQCPSDSVQSNGTLCRNSTGLCDNTEYCNGTSDQCPPDTLQPDGTICRNSTGSCDNTEYCNGTSDQCPSDTFQPDGTICRTSTGLCDNTEYCNGTSDQCPPDVLQPNGTLCRNSTGPCDPAETCDGQTGACPINMFFSNGTQCQTIDQCSSFENGFCNGSSGICFTAMNITCTFPSTKSTVSSAASHSAKSHSSFSLQNKIIIAVVVSAGVLVIGAITGIILYKRKTRANVDSTDLEILAESDKWK